MIATPSSSASASTASPADAPRSDLSTGNKIGFALSAAVEAMLPVAASGRRVHSRIIRSTTTRMANPRRLGGDRRSAYGQQTALIAAARKYFMVCTLGLSPDLGRRSRRVSLARSLARANPALFRGDRDDRFRDANSRRAFDRTCWTARCIHIAARDVSRNEMTRGFFVWPTSSRCSRNTCRKRSLERNEGPLLGATFDAFVVVHNDSPESPRWHVHSLERARAIEDRYKCQGTLPDDC